MLAVLSTDVVEKEREIADLEWRLQCSNAQLEMEAQIRRHEIELITQLYTRCRCFCPSLPHTQC